jgi:hypothetical protein
MVGRTACEAKRRAEVGPELNDKGNAGNRQPRQRRSAWRVQARPVSCGGATGLVLMGYLHDLLPISLSFLIPRSRLQFDGRVHSRAGF